MSLLFSSLQTSVSILQDNQTLSIQLATENNIMLKKILSALQCLSKPQSYTGAKNVKDYDSSSTSSPRIFSSQDSQWIIRIDMDNIDCSDAKTIQDIVRSIFKDALKRTVEALDEQVPKRRILG
ncbi:hypothetical protein L1987_71583 [Smallanthus sonchifolius]|uniref:Uncharacterized protein n=1 Tax=Smallanthus sonchifolius TaxID=185202 RepID=A0ACB9AUG2_9ASTR|nr:hypothetical protein L1987_71583 [Smallanthus sonchifolius]